MKNLPAGLTDNNLEVFKHQGKLLALQNGHTIDYFELPEMMREPFQTELIRDKEAFKCLQTQFNLYDSNDIEYQFVCCRYGALDHKPDFDGIKVTADAPGCNKLMDCQGFNIVCKVPPGPNGILSRSEYMVAKLVGEGKMDKEIADILDIKVPTVRTHISRIHQKLCVNNRIEITLWAQKHGIV